MNLSLKHKLMLQSLSPLAFLTIVRNFKFTPVSELAENQSYWGEFVRLNNVLIVVFLLCATWILAAVISFISFTAFRWTDKKQGYQLSSFVEKEDASLNFFMSGNIPYYCGYDVCAAKQNTFVLCESCVGNFRIPSL